MSDEGGDAPGRATEARSTSGERLAHDHERHPADLAPEFQRDPPGASGDVPPGRDPHALAVGAAALEALRERGPGRMLSVVTLPVGEGLKQGGPGAVIPTREAHDLREHGGGILAWPVTLRMAPRIG